MAININKTILIALIFISAINIFGECRKKSDCIGTTYNFNLGIRGHPDSDSVNIGDTIFFEIDEPVILNDLSSGTQINFSNAKNMSNTFGLPELISINV
jgi:hypothetical protein